MEKDMKKLMKNLIEMIMVVDDQAHTFDVKSPEYMFLSGQRSALINVIVIAQELSEEVKE